MAHTDNLVVDALITAKRPEIERQGIELKVIADLKPLDNWDAIDLTAIFGNALDNAVEAVSDITIPEKRLITIKSYTESGYCICKITNFFEGFILRTGDTFSSTKAPERGIGLRSIRYSVERNHGNMEIDTTDDAFTLVLLLPIK